MLAVTAALVLAGCGGDDEGATPTTARPTTTSTVAPTTSTTTAVDTSTAVWPWASSTTRYTDPVAAAKGYAVDFVGFRDPIVGEFMQGDSRSGEVEVRAKAAGPATTVFVRQLGADDTWWVLGSATGNIELTVPDTGAIVTSPLQLAGRARAFEGTVQVEVREDGRRQPIGSGVVTGSGDGTLGPFEGSVTFTAPAARDGALVLLTTSAEDGRVWEAGAIRLHFGS